MIKKKSKTSGLMREYVGILIFVCLIICISFFMIRYIINNSFMEESAESAEVVFHQAEDNLRLFEEDIENLYTNIATGQTVIGFLKVEDFAERSGKLREFYQIAGSNMRISRNLENIMLYDEEDNLVTSMGEVFIPKPEGMELSGMITYTGIMESRENRQNYFGVAMPVFDTEETGGYIFLGSVFLLFNVENLQGILDSALLNEEAASAVLDRDGNVMAGTDKWEEEYALLGTPSEGNDYIVNTKELEQSGWKLINIIPKSSMLNNVNQMMQIMYITYVAVIIAMAAVCVTMYVRILKPIRRQMEFMTNYTEDTGQRIEVLENNELGELAGKMNLMLDGIEQLNGRIIENQKKYLELEYAKKQTEMAAYKSQINPHFMYNTFECIRGMALYHGEKEIAELAKSLSKLFRYNVKGDEIVTIQEVLQNLQEYAKIIQYRFMGKYKVEVKSDREALTEKIPKMLIQPLVENAVLHGLETQVEGGSVETAIELCSEDKLKIIVRDSGCGIASEKMEEIREAFRAYDENGCVYNKNQGIGILNVYQRIRLFYGKAADVSIESSEGKGTAITLILPRGIARERIEQKLTFAGREAAAEK